MVLHVIGACLLAFLVSAGFGKIYLPWLEKKRAHQPLKDEVARIYAGKAADGETGNKG